MKQFHVSILFLIAALNLTAQHISGHVLTAIDKSPLIGATIFISDLKTGTVTDENGFFSLENMPKGSFLAEVSAIGFAKLVVKIKTTDTVPLEILLPETAV